MEIPKVICFVIIYSLLVINFFFSKFSSNLQMLIKFLMFILVYLWGIIWRTNMVILIAILYNIIQSKYILFDCIILYLILVILILLNVSWLTSILKRNVSKNLTLHILLTKTLFNRILLFLYFFLFLLLF